MNKFLSMTMAFLMVVGLLALASGAYFTDLEETAATTFTIKYQQCTLSVRSMDLVNGSQVRPGNHHVYRITVKNEGTMDARWRLGLQMGEKKDTPEEIAFINALTATFALDKDCQPATHSAKVSSFLLDNNPDNWLYDLDLCGGNRDLALLQPGEEITIYMRLDCDSTAKKDIQNGCFKCEFVLDSIQAEGAAEWPVQ